MALREPIESGDALQSSPRAQPLYSFEEFDVTQIGEWPNGLADICDGRTDGLVIHNAFSREEIERIAGRLNRRGPLPDSPFGDILIYGPPLYVETSDLGRYCREASEFRRFCAELCEGGRDFEARIEELLGAMAGDRTVELPSAPDGSPYTPATIRILEVGQGTGWHFENQFLHATSGYRHLSTLINHDDHLAYFVVLEAPKEGGELVLYDLKWHETEWLDTEIGGVRCTGTVGGQPIGKVLGRYAKMNMNPPPGALVVFDGGNILHRVSPAANSGRRVSIGGFVAFSKGRRHVYYWS